MVLAARLPTERQSISTKMDAWKSTHQVPTMRCTRSGRWYRAVDGRTGTTRAGASPRLLRSLQISTADWKRLLGEQTMQCISGGRSTRTLAGRIGSTWAEAFHRARRRVLTLMGAWRSSPEGRMAFITKTGRSIPVAVGPGGINKGGI